MIDIHGYNFIDHGLEGFGPEDLKDLLYQGATGYQVYQAGQEAKKRGLHISKEVRPYLSDQGASMEFGAVGGAGFGPADIAHLGQGDKSRADLDLVIEKANEAARLGLRVHPEVNKWIKGLELARDKKRREQELKNMQTAMTAANRPRVRYTDESRVGKPGDMQRRSPGRSRTEERNIASLKRSKQSSYVSRHGGASKRLGINTGTA